MNGRILELARNPALFQINDLELLNSEIQKHPYIQSLRALHLLGTHRLKPENYSSELSITAAYTTDKKILYQLINSVEEKTTPVETAPEAEAKQPEPTKEPEDKFCGIKSNPIEAPTPVFINGELNRILFEGEEDFLDREPDSIDLESTIESGQLVTQKPDQVNTSAANTEEVQNLSIDSEAENLLKEEIIKENPGIEDQSKVEQTPEINLPEVNREENSKITNTDSDNEFSEMPVVENFSPEKIVKEEEIEEDKQVIKKAENVSFHEVEELLPKVELDNDAKKTENEEKQKFTESADAENFSKEEIVVEENISEEQPVVEDSSELSFHAMDEFLPEVKITVNAEKSEIQEAPKPSVNKHEEEMKRLIAEVEAKVKAAKKPTANSNEKDQIPADADVNFAETQSFDIKKEDKPTDRIEELIVKGTQEKKEQIQEEKSPVKENHAAGSIDSVVKEAKSAWKPMSFSANTPDALISKKNQEIPVKKEEISTGIIETGKNAETEANKNQETQSMERTAFNVSFFSENVSPLSEEENQNHKITAEKSKVEELVNSNVPTFINTWQNWLKINRTEGQTKEKLEISITEIKNKVIENFIEKEPRISKLKDESDFVIKEKNDDISHLMTETLANLYIEQKLYSKAIKAFVILSKKHPKKKAYFEEKIKEIKELRQNK